MPSFLFLLIITVADYYYLSWIFGGRYQRSDLASIYSIGLLLLIFNSLIVWALLHQLLAARKGKLTILVEDKVYEPGSELQGKLSVNLKIPLLIETLSITLSAIKTRRDDRQTYNDVIWKKEIIMVDATHLGEGNYEYDFSVTIPFEKKDTPTSQVAKLIDLVVSGEISWQLEAALSNQGVDLKDTKLISVNSSNILT